MRKSLALVAVGIVGTLAVVTAVGAQDKGQADRGPKWVVMAKAAVIKPSQEGGKLSFWNGRVDTQGYSEIRYSIEVRQKGGAQLSRNCVLRLSSGHVIGINDKVDTVGQVTEDISKTGTMEAKIWGPATNAHLVVDGFEGEMEVHAYAYLIP